MSPVRLVTLIALVLAAVIIGSGYFWLPALIHTIQKQDCIAAGYTDCDE